MYFERRNKWCSNSKLRFTNIVIKLAGDKKQKRNRVYQPKFLK